MNLFGEEILARGKRWRPNPLPNVPRTGWVMKNRFPDLSGAKVICADVETHDPLIKEFGAGWGSGRGHIIGISLATDDGFNQYYPIRHTVGDNHDAQQVIRYIKEQLSRPHQPKVFHNALYDVGYLEHEGISVVGKVFCTWIAEKLIDHSASASLEDTAQRYLGEGKSSEELYRWSWSAFGQGKPKNNSEMRALSMQNLYRTPAELVGFYAESDTALPLDILPKQWSRMEEMGLLDVFEMECGLIPLLVQMRREGVSVDLDAAELAYQQIDLSAKELQQQVDSIAGCALNTGSPIEVGRVFDRLKLRYPLTAKSGKPQLKAEFLKTLEHPLGKMIIDLQELLKYQSTFVKGFILDSHINGKIYPSFNMLRAVTGRASCSQPNCQQIPSRNELAKVIRSIFIPDVGHDHFRKYDYSAVESRILGHFAVGQGARQLRQEYKDKPSTNYHHFTRDMIKKLVGLELEHKHVKCVNFAGIYGASEKKLQAMMGLSDTEANTFFEAYHSGLPYIKATMKHCSEQAEVNGFTQTIFGRRVAFNHFEPKYSARGAERSPALPFDKALQVYGPNIKRAFLHKALNAVIQGSAADLMKMAMLKCWQDGIFAETGVPRMLIHDEATFSVKPGVAEDAFAAMKHTMETAISFRVPILVEGEKGSSWGCTEKII